MASATTSSRYLSGNDPPRRSSTTSSPSPSEPSLHPAHSPKHPLRLPVLARTRHPHSSPSHTTWESVGTWRREQCRKKRRIRPRSSHGPSREAPSSLDDTRPIELGSSGQRGHAILQGTLRSPAVKRCRRERRCQSPTLQSTIQHEPATREQQHLFGTFHTLPMIFHTIVHSSRSQSLQTRCITIPSVPSASPFSFRHFTTTHLREEQRET